MCEVYEGLVQGHVCVFDSYSLSRCVVIVCFSLTACELPICSGVLHFVFSISRENIFIIKKKLSRRQKRSKLTIQTIKSIQSIQYAVRGLLKCCARELYRKLLWITFGPSFLYVTLVCPVYCLYFASVTFCLCSCVFCFVCVQFQEYVYILRCLFCHVRF